MIDTHLNGSFFAVIGCGQISGHVPHLFRNLDESSDLNRFKFFDRTTDYLSLDLNKFQGVFLAVQDSQIKSTFLELKEFFPKDTAFFHLSGSMYFHEITGVHPLMTFAKSSRDIDHNSVPLYTDSKDFYAKNQDKLKNLKFLPQELKVKYHAMAVMLGNFSQQYLQKLKEIFPKELDFYDYQMLVEHSVAHIFDKNSKAKLTGPLIRGDFNTIQKHKDAFKGGDSHHVLWMYEHMETLLQQELTDL